MPQTQVKMPDGSVKTYNIPEGASKAQIEDFLNAQSAPQSVADQARQRLASRGLTPEAVKAGQGVAPLPGDTGPGTPVGRSILQGIGIPTSMDEVRSAGLDSALNVGTAGMYGAAKTSVGMLQDAMSGHVPIVGRPIEALAAPTVASMQNRPQTPDENAGAIRTASGAIPQLVMFSPTVRGAVGSALPSSIDGVAPKTAANLINRWLGDGAIDTTMGKDAGRGISRGKIVAATADGVQAKVQSSIADGQAVVKRLLSTPAAQAPTIDGLQLVRDAFGEPPLNITGATLGRWEEFAGNIAQEVQKMSDGSGKISPAQTDALKNKIDVNFGKPTTGVTSDPTELNLNQKAGAVRRVFDHAVDQQVHGYQEINDHLGDLHHADNILTKKIAENATAEPFSLNPKALVRGTFADALRSGGAQGTRPGLLTTPGRTALAAMLSDRPNLNTVAPVPTAPPVAAPWLDQVLQKYGARPPENPNPGMPIEPAPASPSITVAPDVRRMFSDPDGPMILGQIAQSPHTESILQQIPSGSKIIGHGYEAVVLENPRNPGQVIRVGRTIPGVTDRPAIDGVLQPTSVKRFGNWSIETLPKVTMGASPSQVSALRQRLLGQGFDLYDVADQRAIDSNIGRLPDGTAVVVDGGAVIPARK